MTFVDFWLALTMADSSDFASGIFDGTGTPPDGMNDVMIAMLERRLDTDIDWSVCNIDEEELKAKMKLDAYANRMMRLVSTIKNRDKGYANVYFDKEGSGVKVNSVYAMFPDRAQLLKTHSDAVYCGSISVSSKDPHVLMLITVVDMDARMRMAAMGVAMSDDKESWSSFFRWVKERVPQFSPNCVITNDDLHIHSAFEETIKPKACLIVCYRRKTRLSQLKTIVSADNTEELRRKYEGIKAFAVEHRSDENLPAVFRHKFQNALSTLTVFTGDYLCKVNPVMKCLKDFILPKVFDVFYSVAAVKFYWANEAI